MKDDTLNVYSKYRYFLHLLSNERLMLFRKNKDELDFDNFFDLYNHVIRYHWLIKIPWRRFHTTRYQIIKRFKNERIIIKRSAYMDLLREYFCYDIANIICEFI